MGMPWRHTEIEVGVNIVHLLPWYDLIHHHFVKTCMIHFLPCRRSAVFIFYEIGNYWITSSFSSMISSTISSISST